ncbi:MAG: type II secretion system F family protein [bacterium]|nr:type II secretion system F family protein [bacterium]MDE0351885.1 type II secretion system F family protein [bacterium]
MTLFTMMSVAVVVYVMTAGRSVGVRSIAATGAAIGLANPLACASLGLVWYSLRRRRAIRRERLARRRAEGELELLTHSMLIGLSGGLSPAGALALARESLSSSLGQEVDRILRHAVKAGFTPSLMSARGVGGRLFRQVGAAHLSGSPLELALTALAAEYREAARSSAVEKARRLPVRMVLPLTLLMLPGLLILMIGPLVLPSLARLLDPFMSF